MRPRFLLMETYGVTTANVDLAHLLYSFTENVRQGRLDGVGAKTFRDELQKHISRITKSRTHKPGVQSLLTRLQQLIVDVEAHDARENGWVGFCRSILLHDGNKLHAFHGEWVAAMLAYLREEIEQQTTILMDAKGSASEQIFQLAVEADVRNSTRHKTYFKGLVPPLHRASPY